MVFFKDKRIRTLVLIMGVLVAIGLLIARSYYRSVNRAVDPRVIQARELYAQYNTLANYNDFEQVFLLLDSIEQLYRAVPHYKRSFEVGVLYNNRGAAYLIMAMHHDSLNIKSVYLSQLSSDSLLRLARRAVNESIAIYTEWLAEYGDKTEQEIEDMLTGDFLIGLQGYEAEMIARYKKSRIKEIVDAREETKRRLSVSYTNLGIIYRNLEEYELAAKQYQKAIELWERNLVAENNLNLLLGRPMKKRNMIQKLFPPER